MIPYGRQSINDEDIDAVVNVLRSDFLTSGPHVETFEKEIATISNASYAAACANGTAALHLACMAAGITEGDIVVVPTITFLATANAVRYVGGVVAFCDVEPDTGLISIPSLQQVLAELKEAGKKAKAIIPVHLAGNVAALAEISKIAKSENLIVIEDACHAFGGKYISEGLERCVGDNTYADYTVFSFHPVKTVATGEGGAITTNSIENHQRLKQLLSHGMTRNTEDFKNDSLAFEDGQSNPWYYEMQMLGYNYRLTDIQCALGISQLKRLDQFIEKRAALRAHYEEILQPHHDKIKIVPALTNHKTSWHLCVVSIDYASAKTTRAQLMLQLKSCNVGTQVHYIPVHRQPFYQNTTHYTSFDGAEHYYSQCLSLPLFPDMRLEDVEYVVNTLIGQLK